MQGIPAHASHYRRRWEAEGYQTEHVGGGISRCCGLVDEFVPTDHVVGQSDGALDPPARRLTGSLHVRVWEVSEWAGVRVSQWAGVGGVGGVGGVPILPPVGPRCVWRGVAVSGSVCQFRVCSCVLGQCTRSVGNAPLLFGCSAPYRV